MLNGKIKIPFTQNFLGFYIGDTNKPEWEENKIVVAYKYTPNHKFTEQLNNCDIFYDKYVENINGILTYVYAFIPPIKFKKDFKLITKEQFGNFSWEYEKSFLEYWKNIGTVNKRFEGETTNSRTSTIFSTNRYLNLNEV